MNKIYGNYIPVILSFIALLWSGHQDTQAQGGISGYIYDNEGEPLSFATIYVKQTETGTTTNIEGYFSLTLAPGKYNLFFQYLGYAAQ